MERLRRWYAWFLRHAPRMRDVLFAGFSLLTIALQASENGWSAEDWFVIGLGVTASLALIWRRRYPVVVTLIGILAMATTQIFMPMCLALLTLAVRRRDLTLAVLGTAGYASYVASGWAEEGEPGVLLITGPFMIGTWIAVGAYIGARRDLLGSLRDRAERAEAERELRAEQARLGERARIAQEMHDVLAHKVSLIALHAGGLEINPTVGPGKVESSAGLIRETARQAMEDLREVLGVLRTDVSVDGADLTPVPRAADLHRLVEASRAAGVAVTGDIALPEDVPDQLGRTLYRIVQEALTNVHKHARGASTEVVVQGNEVAGVTARVTNLRPVAAGSLLPGAGAGLVGLRERVDLVGGHLTTGPTDLGGWQVEAWLPWPRTTLPTAHPPIPPQTKGPASPPPGPTPTSPAPTPTSPTPPGGSAPASTPPPGPRSRPGSASASAESGCVLAGVPQGSVERRAAEGTPAPGPGQVPGETWMRLPGKGRGGG